MKAEFVEPVCVTLKVLAGARIDDAVREAIGMAMSTSMDVNFTFNDKTYSVHWRELVAQILDQHP